MRIAFALSAMGTVERDVPAPMKLHEASGKRTLEEEYKVTAEYASYKIPRQPATTPEDDINVERDSTIQFTARLPPQGAVAFLMEDKMFDIVAGISSRLLGPEKNVSRKDTLEKNYSEPDEQARIAPVVRKLNLKGTKPIKPSDLGKALDDAYYKRNCTTHANDAELERQVKRFIRVGGVVMLQDDFPIECALLQAYDDIKGLFL